MRSVEEGRGSPDEATSHDVERRQPLAGNGTTRQLAALRAELQVLEERHAASLEAIHREASRAATVVAENQKLKHHLAAATDEILALRGELEASETRAAQSRETVGSLTQSLAQVQLRVEKLARRNDHLTHAREAKASGAATLAALRNEVVSLRAELTRQWARQVQEREVLQIAITDMRIATPEGEANLARLEGECSALRARADREHAEGDVLRRAVMRLQAEVATREAERAAFLSSTSWRLTAPLRALVQFMRRR